MLEKLPHAVGHLLQGIGPGLEKTTYFGDDVSTTPETITVESGAFASGAPIPPRYTDDGEGVSPPLAWHGVPAGAAELALIIEDADSPTPQPLVHAIVWRLPGGDGSIPEGGLKGGGEPGADYRLGLNSYLKAAYIPPDPPTGHGPHRYVVQVFALDRRLDLSDAPGRTALRDSMRGHVIARGALIGTYERP